MFRASSIYRKVARKFPSRIAPRVVSINASLRRLLFRSKLRRLVSQDEELKFAKNIKRLGLYEDRRQHAFGRVRSTKGFVSVSHRLQAVPRTEEVFRERSRLRETSERVGFSRPWRVIICARRKMRREVLHAKRRTGHGAGTRFPKQKPKYNELSPIVCWST